MLPPQLLTFIAHKRRALMTIAGTVLLSSMLFTACSGFGGSGTTSPTSTATASSQSLTKLHWCNKPTILFRDEHAPVTVTTTSGTPATGTPATGTPVTGTPTASATASTPTPTPSAPTSVTDWSQVEPNLGFTVYLPKSLPTNTCLVSASGTFHDPIFGGSFSIGYLLPNHSSITLAEAPERSNSLSFQCSTSGSPAPKVPQASTTTPTASATATPLLLCTGVRSGTNIVFSAPGTEATLQQFFNNLQPNISWVPAS
ncbi:MAG TPA: hypothetical protein VNG51_12550 [Ktedonobacteraceae bacterium]|nr:hypothetical protein [Ktedonobacteraceae bacterium]